MSKNILKLVFFTFLFQFNYFVVHAQNQLSSAGRTLVNDLQPGSGAQQLTTQCGKDTVYYPYNKTTQFQGINVINTSNNGNGFAQWYPAPQAVTVSGFDFFAWVAPTNYTGPINVTCNLYNAGADSMPTGSPVRTVTVAVDSSFGGGMLSVLKRTAFFTSSYTTSSPYVITIENTSTTGVSIVANSWNATGGGNGKAEWLSSVRFGTNWIRSYNVNVSSVTFDADFIFLPYVEYSITAGFTVSSNCVSNNGTINFTNTSSALLNSKFYNRWVYFNIPQNAYYWNFGNGANYAVNPSRTYTSAGNYTVQMVAGMLGWIRNCYDTATTSLFATPAAPSITSNAPVCAGDSLILSGPAISGATYAWSGPSNFNGTTKDTVLRNVNSSNSGTYGLTVTVNGCTSQSGSLSATVNNIPATPTANNNGPLCLGQDLQLSTPSLTNASYEWTGPNSFSSTVQNPVITNVSNANAGSYTVKVIVGGCKSQAGSTTMSIGSQPAAPSVSNNGPLCAGQNLQLTATNSTNATYTWTGPNSFSSSTQSPSINGVTSGAAGTYSCTVTVPGCGTSSAASTVVTITSLPNAPTAGNNGPICDGKTLSLTASTITGATYNWTGPNSFTSTDQNPVISNFAAVSAGNYSVTATVSGCGTSSAGTTTVAYNPGPSAPTVSSNDPLCAGSSLNLQASTVTGATYSWSGPNNFTSSLQNPVIPNSSTANSGDYTVTATIANCGTSPAGTVKVTVNPIPSVPNVSNNSPVCQGRTVNLNASSIPNAFYEWTGPNSYTSTLQNPSISNASSTNEGTYSVKVKVNNCYSSTVNIPVVVNPKPTTPVASKTGAACDGADLQLNATSITGAGYSWTGPNGFLSYDQNPLVSGISLANTGTYNVTAAIAGCNSDVGNVNITVGTKPNINSILGPINSNRNATSSYSVSFTPGSSYLWQIVGGNQISGGTSNAITVQWGSAGVGSVSITETNQSGCTGNAYNIDIALWHVGINQPEASQLSVFPNPAKNYIRIKAVNPENKLLTLTDVTGKTVKTITVSQPEENLFIGDLPDGIYFLNFDHATPVKIVKIK